MSVTACLGLQGWTTASGVCHYPAAATASTAANNRHVVSPEHFWNTWWGSSKTYDLSIGVCGL